MASFGDRLRQEREARGTTVEDVSHRTGIRLDFLQALEGARFGALPGRAFGKMYIRAYAEVLGFDPRPLIEAYDRERTVWEDSPEAVSLQGSFEPPPRDDSGEQDEDFAEAPEEPAVPAARPAGLSEQPLGRRPVIAAVIVCGFLTTAAAGYYAFIQAPREEPPVAPERLHAPVATEVASASPAAPSTAGTVLEPPPDGAPPEPSPAPSVPRAARRAAATGITAASPLSIPESAIGRRVVDRRLIEPATVFAPRDTAVFWTRVRGGGPGRTIRHVWKRNGRAVQTVELPLGGADWRTHSRKTLGEPGAWSVEARDAGGRVLAMAEFTCAAEGPR